MLKRFLFSILSVLLGGCLFTACQSDQPDERLFELWYDQPASIWEEALPIGNGRLGAMIYGIPEEEHIQFNEETLWDSGPREYNRQGAWRNLDRIRRLLFEGRQREAEELAGRTFMGRKTYEDEFVELRQRYSDSIYHLPIVQQALQPGFDDSGWETMFIDFKSVWETKGLPDTNGSVLFRKVVNIPENWQELPVKFYMGRIKDEDYTYVNGQRIGHTYDENGSRTYSIPGGVFRPGENEIVVLINNFFSTGGFNGVRQPPYKMNLQPQGNFRDTITVEGDWKYRLIDDYPPYYPQYQANYQAFGDLKIVFDGHGSFSNFRRSLNLNEAMAYVTYESNGVTYTREYLASHPDDVIAMKYSASKDGALSFTASFETPHHINDISVVDDNTLSLKVNIDNGDMSGCAILTIDLDGGDVEATTNGIRVTEANTAVLKLVAETDYVAWNEIGGNPVAKSLMEYDRVSDLSFENLKTNHLYDYQPLFNRFHIDLGGHQKRLMTTDQRIRNIDVEHDNDLAALYVQYARYLMLSSGRKGTNPPNLQGIWNNQQFPAWGSKYTLNINCEMNFWPVEPLNIAECHHSLFQLIEEVAEAGAKTAREYYNAPGWVVHHNTDQWRGTAPINNPNHGIWVTGGAWLCTHLWEHYLYSQDVDFLRHKAFPLMKGAAEFFTEFLIKDPVSGYLISTPSNSPEHGGLVAGPAMDHQIIRELYRQVIESSRILDKDHEFAALLSEQLAQLPPDRIGRHGQLQEWMDDIDDTTSVHRHVSHLWAVHPGNEINWEDTPELMEAARQALIYRGDDGTGWSLAWKINFWARFLDGEHAHHMIRMLLSDALDPARDGGGGSYPNLFDAHPPFQIDGNFGGAAGIIEMIVQSHLNTIDLLPAIPSVWSDGKVEGLRVRGGFELDFEWKNGTPVAVKVYSNSGNTLKLRVGDKLITRETEVGGEYLFTDW